MSFLEKRMKKKSRHRNPPDVRPHLCRTVGYM